VLYFFFVAFLLAIGGYQRGFAGQVVHVATFFVVGLFFGGGYFLSVDRGWFGAVVISFVFSVANDS
jgi:hypothetical protein